MSDLESDAETRNPTPPRSPTPDQEQNDAEKSNQTSLGEGDCQGESSKKLIPTRQKRKIVSACSKENDNSWVLPEHIAEFYDDECNRFINRKDLKEAILEDCPVPEIFAKVPRLDSYMKRIINDKEKPNGGASVLARDDELIDIAGAVKEVMAPLGQL